MSDSTHLTPRQQLLLSFLNGADAKDLDPIRIMKGLFLFSQRAPETWRLPEGAVYEFEPYMYGPFSTDVSLDLNHLRQQGLLRTTTVSGRNWSYYSLTPRGESVIAEVVQALPNPAVRYLAALREFVCEMSFRDLLDSVYEEYPEYAVNSVFKATKSASN